MPLIDSTNTYINFLQDFKSESKRVPAFRDLIEPCRDVCIRVEKIAKALQRYAEGETEAVEFPFSEVLETRKRIKNLISKASPILDVSFDFIILLRETNRLLSQLTIAKQVFVSRNQAREAVVNVFRNDPLPKKAYTVLRGDTLIGIAQRIMPDTDRQEAIASIISLNNLDYPYLVTDSMDEFLNPSLKVAKTGDKIFVPQSASITGNDVVAAGEDLFVSLFGTDIELRTDTNSSFSSSTTTRFNAGTVGLEVGDVRVVSGIANLAQSLINKILTDRRSLPLHPTYGASFSRFVGLEASDMNIQLAGFEVGRVVASDPRINSVSNLKAAVVPELPTMLKVTFDAHVIGTDSPVSLSLVIPR